MSFPVIEMLVLISIGAIAVLVWMILKLKEPQIDNAIDKMKTKDNSFPDLNKVKDELDSEFETEPVEKRIKKAKQEKKIEVKKEEKAISEKPALQKDFEELERL